MNKVFLTNAVISKGYDKTPALVFSESGESVRFRIGYKVYDSREENNTRWINIKVRALKTLTERIKKMKLKEGSYINICGALDEDVWEDSQTQELRREKVIVLSDIEYASGGNSASGKTEKENGEDEPVTPEPKKSGSGNFTGYEAPESGGFF